MTTHQIVHETAQQLIPWYVNGTLNEHDMATVDDHLQYCLHCRAEVDQEVDQARRLHSETDNRLNALLATEQKNFDELLNALPRTTPLYRRYMRRPLLAATAAVLLLALLIPLQMITMQQTPIEATDETLFDAQTTVPETSQGPVLQVVFHPDTPEQAIRTLLLETDSQLLGNPTPQGVYRIAIHTSDAGGFANRLRHHPAVRWAEVER